jgi:hypothetical protein
MDVFHIRLKRRKNNAYRMLMESPSTDIASAIFEICTTMKSALRSFYMNKIE